jgi:hypothetical protein
MSVQGTISRKTPMVDRYWPRVERTSEQDACWLWNQRVNSSGYGEIRNDEGRIVSAHRIAWELAYGPIPDGLHVLHSCADRYPAGDRTSRRCQNPAHLRLGTNTDNVADRVNSGREADHAGEANGRARLTVDDVRNVRRALADGLGYKAIAAPLGVCPATIWHIDVGNTWRSVD